MVSVGIDLICKVDVNLFFMMSKKLGRSAMTMIVVIMIIDKDDSQDTS